MKNLLLLFSLLLFTGFPGTSLAEIPTDYPRDKDSYHLFNPVPDALLREMATDRPDKTESPYTVDAGHYQAEISLIDYTYDRHNPDDEGINNLSVLPFNIKAGLLNNVDLQIVVSPYLRERVKTSDGTEKKNGFGDVQSRIKINLWGNDQGQTALAIMPFIKFPTNTDKLGNDDFEGGIIIPFAVALPADWNMGLMTEFDFNEDSNGEHYTDFINTITFSHVIAGNLNGYVEFFSSFNNNEGSRWIGTVDTGVTYAVTNNIQLDAGVNIGVTRSADDFNPFCGISTRF